MQREPAGRRPGQLARQAVRDVIRIVGKKGKVDVARQRAVEREHRRQAMRGSDVAEDPAEIMLRGILELEPRGTCLDAERMPPVLVRESSRAPGAARVGG